MTTKRQLVQNMFCSMCAFATLLSGLFALAIWPLFGAMLIIGGLALALYAAGGVHEADEDDKPLGDRSNFHET